MTRSELSVANTDISPLDPAGTMAAFAVMPPRFAFRVEASGCGCPAGHAVRKPKGPPLGTAVKFMEYAWAVAGRLHGPERTGKVRAMPGARNGPAKGAAARRVSTRRHGVTG